MKIRVTIDFEDNGYSASSSDVSNVLLLAEGDTIEEVKLDMLSVIEELANMPNAPEALKDGYHVEWSFSASSFLNKFSHIISQAGLAKMAGINPNLLTAYKLGDKKPRKKQIEKLQKAINTFANDLLSTPLNL